MPRFLWSLTALLATLALLGTAGCSGHRRQTWSGNCGSYRVYADQSHITVSGKGINLSANSSDVQNVANNGGSFKVTDASGNQFSVTLSDNAREALNNQDPCPAISEILAALPASSSASDAGSNTDTGSDNSHSPAGAVTPTPTSRPSTGSSNAQLTGDYVLYPGSYGDLSFKGGKIALARQQGSDTKKPAVYVFKNLTLDTCTLSFDPGRSLMYLDGDLAVTASTIASTGDARNLLILGTKSCSNMAFFKCLQPFSAGIFAPTASISLAYTSLTGAAVGANVLTSNSAITYDQHLKMTNLPGPGMAAPRSVQEAHQ